MQFFLRERRLAAGLTQQELADLLQVAKNTISRYETGEREPGVTEIFRISEALRIQPYELFVEPGDALVDPLIQSLPDDARAHIIRMVRAFADTYRKP